jgi:thiaminase/transcriptional activator TenA
MATPEPPMQGSDTRLSSNLWGASEPIWHRIRAHPFIAGLTDGRLAMEVFRFYVVQDSHYLRHYARALSVLAARAPAERDILMFNQHAATAILVEQQLHNSFFQDFGMSREDVQAAEMAPTNVAYCSYLVSVAYGGSFAEGLAAVLPCYWIYWEVGKALMDAGSPNPLYRRWIDTYGGEEFGAAVEAVLALTDRVGAQVGPPERERMMTHYLATSRYEWMFWDMAYRLERWPV